MDLTFNTPDTIRLNGQGVAETPDMISSIVSYQDGFMLGGVHNGFDFSSSNLTHITRTGKARRYLPLATILRGRTFYGLQRPPYCLAVQQDSLLLIGGLLNGYRLLGDSLKPAKGLLRMLPNGLIDTTFQTQPVLDGSASSIKLSADGRIYCGGSFTTVQGKQMRNVCRLSSNGKVDTTFRVGAGFNGDVKSIAIQADGKVVVGGLFTSYKGQPANHIARLLPYGDIDPSFSVASGFDATVNVVDIDPSGRIWAGGAFTQYQSQNTPAIVCLTNSGALATTPSIYSSLTGECKALACLPDGRTIIGGILNYQEYNGLMMLDANMEPVASFAPRIQTSLPNITALHPDGRGGLLVAGQFQYVNDTARSGLVRLELANGRVDNAFMRGSGANKAVSHIFEDSKGRVMIGGKFATVNGQPRTELTARLKTNGVLDTSWQPETNGYSLGTFPSTANVTRFFSQGRYGSLIQGETYYNSFGHLGFPLLRLDSTGKSDSTFLPIHQPFHFALARRDGRVMLDRDTTAYEGMPLFYQTLPDGRIDTAFHCPIIYGQDSMPNLYDGNVSETRHGKIYVGYNRDTTGGRGPRLVRLLRNGRIDTTFKCPTMTHCTIGNVYPLRDGSVQVFIYNGTTVRDTVIVNGHKVRYCFKLDVSGRFDTLYRGDVYVYSTLTMQNNDKLLVNNRRLTKQGEQDPNFTFYQENFGGGNGPREAIYVRKNGQILVAGVFSHIADSVRNNFAQLYNCTAPSVTPQIAATPAQICFGDTLRLSTTAPGPPGLTYHWLFVPDSGADIDYPLDATLDERTRVAFVPQQSGRYQVAAISEVCSTGYSQPIHVEVVKFPKPVLSASSGILTASPNNAGTYRWYRANSFLPWATGPALVADTVGVYSVEAIYGPGCLSPRSDTVVILTTQTKLLAESSLRIWPNPTSSRISLETTIGGEAKLYNVQGQFLESFVLQKGVPIVLTLPPTTGLYFLRFGTQVHPIVVAK